MARSLGIPAGLFHYLLMIMTAITSVAAFETVGSILVLAMLAVIFSPKGVISTVRKRKAFIAEPS